MRNIESPLIHRRDWLQAATWLGAAALIGKSRADDPRPQVVNPRATSGDRKHAPDWQQRLTITVGNDKGDLRGETQQVIQAAVDHLSGFGGGTVRLLAGTWRMRNSVYLRSNIRLVGEGDKSILIKEPSTSTPLAADSDWFDQEITLADSAGFALGDGVCLQTKNADTGAAVVLKRTLVANSGNRFRLDRPLRENLWQLGKSTCSTLFPILSGDGIEQVAIENLTLDGNRAANDNLNGNYGGCVFLQDCNDVGIRQVTARNYNGDGFSWQICHDVVVENCRSLDHADLGLHPGSGSQRPRIRGNQLERNGIGIFFCWGVKFGLAEANQIVDNRIGVSIGHRDTDNLIRDNVIRGSLETGVLYRPERGPGFAPHRNRLEANQIVDNGGPGAAAIDLQGASQGNLIARNVIRETRSPAMRVGIRISQATEELQLVDNHIDGFATAVDDQRKG